MNEPLIITGTLLKANDLQTGTGQKGVWKKREFIIETKGQYPKKVCLTAWGDKVDSLAQIPLNSEISVHFNLESREYNERWYTEVKPYKIELSQSAPTQETNSDEFPPEWN